MCTVSYIPKSINEFILTSNRDERTERPTFLPNIEQIANVNVLFPKDKEAGGTWIAMDENGRVACLLNGAYKLHKRKDEYGLSRGKVLLNLFAFKTSAYFDTVDLSNVEPFTMVVVEPIGKSKNLWELRWDGSQKTIHCLNPNKEHFWTSVTLYSDDVRDEKLNLFNNWLNNTDQINADEIINFHLSEQAYKPSEDEWKERGQWLKTVSVTQVSNINDQMTMIYNDINANKTYNTQIKQKTKSYG